MAAKTNFRGSYTALVTPFKNGALDEAAFRGLVSWQIEQGSHGLVPVGTTGESPTLSHAEHHRVVEMCIDEAKGRVPVIAGAGSNSTREAVDLAKRTAFDVILMDVQMPIMDGFQATAILRSLPPGEGARVPIVAMTAHAMRGDRERCLAAGMDAYISKPIDSRRLVELIESVARLPSD